MTAYRYKSGEINELRTINLLDGIENQDNLNNPDSVFKKSLIKKINELEQLVQKNNKFHDWSPNYQMDSFNKLGEWIIEEKLSHNSEKNIFNIAAYLGQTLVQGDNNLHWDIEKAKRSFDYGCAIITGFKSNNSFNPVRVAQVCFNQIANQKKSTNRLGDIINIWKGYSTDKS